MFLLNTRAITVSVVQSCCPVATDEENDDKERHSIDAPSAVSGYNHSKKVHPMPLLDPPTIQRRHIVIPILTPTPSKMIKNQKQDVESMLLTLDKNNTYETGSELAGTIYFHSPYPFFVEEGEEKSTNSSYFYSDGGEVGGGTLTLALEGIETTTLTGPTRFKSNERMVYNDSFRFLRQEKKFPLNKSISGTLAIKFSLKIPQDLPEPMESFCANLEERSTFERGECKLSYNVTACWEPHQKSRDLEGENGVNEKKNSVKASSMHRTNVSAVGSSRKVDIVTPKKRGSRSSVALTLSVSSSVEIPSYFCGFLWIVSTRTTFALNVDHTVDKLDLHPSQTLHIGMRNMVDYDTLGLRTSATDGNSNKLTKNKLVAKLTQRIQLLARKQTPLANRNDCRSFLGSQPEPCHETPVQTNTWNLDVTSGGTVTIPSKTTSTANRRNGKRLIMSHTGLLIRVHHDLIVYVLDTKKKSVLATTQPIPVILSSS